MATVTVLIGSITGLLLTGSAGAAPRQTDGGDRSPTGLEGTTACFRDSHHLIVSVVVDESASLQLTDPDAERVDAVLTAVDGLSELSESVDGAEVEIAIGVFGDPFMPLLGFTPVEGEAMAEIRTVARSLEDHRFGTETDLVTALAEVHEQLDERAGEITALGGADPCALILLFTDGGYNLELRGRPKSPESTTKFYAPGDDLSDPEGLRNAMERGVEELCRDGGIVDAIRAGGITVMSVMLERDGFEDLGDADLLRALTVGTGGDRSCGRADDNIRGSFFVADDADLLIARFHELATQLNGGVAIPGDIGITVCDDEPCDEGTRTVGVDPLTRRIRVLGLTPEAELEVRVSGPAGDAVVTGPGTFEIGPVVGEARSVAGRGLTIDLERPDDEGAWAGSWTFTVLADDGVPDTPGLLSVYLHSDLGLALEIDPLTRGESGMITASLDLPEGQDGDLFIDEAVVTARLEDPLTGRAHVIELDGSPGGPYTGEFEVPADHRSGGLRARATIEVRYRSGGRATASSDEALVRVDRPGASIQFSPAELEWPTLSGDGSVSTTLTATAGGEGGCVWFEPAEVTGPDEAGALLITYDDREIVDSDSCIEVAAGSAVDIDVRLEAQHRASGSLRGHLVVHEDAADDATVTDVLIAGRFHRGIDQARRVLAAAVLLLGGLLLPIGLLHLVNAIGARFQRLDAVKAAVLPVRVTDRTIELVDDDRSGRFAIGPDQFESLEGRGSSRDFVFGGIRFRARASRNPFGGTRALAAPEGGAERLRGGVGRRVELEADLAGSWVFLLDPDRTRRGMRNSAEGRVIAFVHETADPAAYQRLQRDIDERLPETAAVLAQAVRST